MMRIARFSFACIALAALAPASASAEGRVDGFRAQTEKWTQTRQLISQERSEWQADRETLRATRDLLRDEKAALEQEIAELGDQGSGADDERRELTLRRAEQLKANTAFEEHVRAMEARVLEIAPQLPKPLRTKLDLLIVQIPTDPEKTKLPLGQRLMNVLGVLAQAEKFNDTATFVGETRAIQGDQKVAVSTLYWGLAQAIYVDQKGEAAGIGRPGADGWSFENDPELVADAKRLLDIYEGNIDAIEFVNFPVEISGR